MSPLSFPVLVFVTVPHQSYIALVLRAVALSGVRVVRRTVGCFHGTHHTSITLRTPLRTPLCHRDMTFFFDPWAVAVDAVDAVHALFAIAADDEDLVGLGREVTGGFPVPQLQRRRDHRAGDLFGGRGGGGGSDGGCVRKRVRGCVRRV